MNFRPLDPQSSALTKLRHSPELQRSIVAVATTPTAPRTLAAVPPRRVDTRKTVIQAVVLLLVLLLVLSVFAAAL